MSLEPSRHPRVRLRIASWTVFAVALGIGVLATPVSAVQGCTSAGRAVIGDIPGGSSRAVRVQTTLRALYPDLRTDSARVRELCEQIDADIAEPDTISLIAAIEATIDTFGLVIQTYPEWRQTIQTGEFSRWAATQPEGAYGSTIKPKTPHDPTAALLISDFHSQRLEGLFYLTSDKIESLGLGGNSTSYRVGPLSASRLTTYGAPDDLVTRVTALQALSFPSWDSLDAAVDIAFDGDTTRIRIEPQPTAAPTIPRDVDARLVRPPARDFNPGSGGAAPDTVTILTFRDLLDLQAIEPSGPERGPGINPEERAGLLRLEGKWFPDGYLFRTAVRLTSGIGPAQPEKLARVLEAAREPMPLAFTDSIGLQPIAWDGGDCGCGLLEGSPGAEAEVLYGLYPFWEATQRSEDLLEKVPVDFEVLDRVGYYGVTFDVDGHIRDSLHWREGKYPANSLPFRGRRFSDFSVKAHQYRTKVDLVVYNADWGHWLPDTLNGSGIGPAFSQLQQEIVGLVSLPTNNFFDRVKPWVSFGQSPRPTLGDGITLDFDFADVTREDQQRLFERLTTGDSAFFPSLDAALDVADGRDRTEAIIFGMDLDYKLNLMVPAHCLGTAEQSLQPCGFFSLDNLISLEPHVDLFIVDMSAQSADSTLDRPTDSLLDRARYLRDAIESNPATRDALGGKIVPLVPSAVQFADFFRRAAPVSNGAGLWPVPIGQPAADSLRAVFRPVAVPDTTTGSVVAKLLVVVEHRFRTLGVEFCEYTCPRRWGLRSVAFLGFLGLVAFWVWTALDPTQKERYESWQFSLFVLLLVAVSTVTLWCDPWWRPKRGEILLTALIVFTLFFVRTRRRLRRQRDFP